MIYKLRNYLLSSGYWNTETAGNIGFTLSILMSDILSRVGLGLRRKKPNIISPALRLGIFNYPTQRSREVVKLVALVLALPNSFKMGN